jgi:peptide/nickel transport system permease protein
MTNKPETETPEHMTMTDSGAQFAHAPLSQGKMIWRRFLRHKLGLIGAIIVVFLVFVFTFAEFFSPYDYESSHANGLQYMPPMLFTGKIHFDGLRAFVYEPVQAKRKVQIGTSEIELPGVFDYLENKDVEYSIKLFASGDEYDLLGLRFLRTNIHLFGTEQLQASKGHLFLLGTDSQGFDLLSMILYGGRVTLGIAPMVIVFSFLLGTLMGGLSGYLGGWADTLIQRITEIFMSFPRLALLLTLAGILGHFGFIPAMVRFWLIVALLALVSWAPLARVIRGQFLSLRESEYTQAARALGAGNRRIIFRHIMPNIMSYLVVAATLAIPDIIILESILSFLGFGIQDPLTSWGLLLRTFTTQGIHLEAQFHPWVLFPAVFIVITVLAFNFLGDALRDAVDPFTVSEAKGEF